jgi:hypothetical protein
MTYDEEGVKKKLSSKIIKVSKHPKKRSGRVFGDKNDANGFRG